MPLPEDFRDDDRNYRTRIVIRVADNPTIGFATGSIVTVCDDCGEAVWLNPNQALPDMPNGLENHGDLNVCFQCIATHNEFNTVTAINPAMAEVMRALGINVDNP